MFTARNFAANTLSTILGFTCAPKALDGGFGQTQGTLGGNALHRCVGALPQARSGHRAEVCQQGGGAGLVLFVGGQQAGCGIAVTVSSGLCQLQGLFHLRGAGFVLCGGKHRANVTVEQFAVQRGRFFVHPCAAQ